MDGRLPFAGRGFIAWVWLVAGAVLIGLSWGGCFPAELLAGQLAEDGRLTAVFSSLLRQSQWMLGFLLVLAAPLQVLSQAAAPFVEPRIRRIPAWILPATLSLMTFLGALFLQEAWFGGIPHVTDAVSHLFQAKIFLLGRLSAPLPPCYEHFAHQNIVMSANGLWHTKYLPGQALWLAAGMKAGVLPLLMPLGAGLSVVCLHSLCRRAFGPAVAALSAVLMTLSPLHLLLSASFMSHSTFVLFALGGVALLAASLERPVNRFGGRGLALSAGFLLGMALAVRPQDFVALAILLILGLWAGRRRWPTWLARVRWAVGGFLVPLGFVCAWNHALYGSVMATGYHFGANSSLTPIIHDTLGFSGRFPLSRAIRHQVWTMLRFNKVLFGWPSSLILVPFAFARRRPRWPDIFCLAGAALMVLVYVPFHYYGFEYEARYYVGAVPFLVVLSARGAQRIVELISARRDAWRAPAAAAAFALLAVSCLHAWLYYWPSYVAPRYSRDYEGVTPEISRQASRALPPGSLVLLDTRQAGDPLYSSGFVANDPLLKASIVFARLLDDNQCLARSFPGRKLFRFVPSESGAEGSFVEVVAANK